MLQSQIDHHYCISLRRSTTVEDHRSAIVVGGKLAPESRHVLSMALRSGFLAAVGCLFALLE